ncbi:hypothetical protein SAMN04487770_13632 [Butyrivibrio sp. ob235]|uniref:hypothetical protein n=1 Tax=Butyrivibrio sp. ob235 TaxID=1761780 RepID=UPI0008CDBB56|nr:hypothetical protein [Butyrivibrio sp. ob235]SEM38789.1 hypothetical protein SAMN04487770_13632 [Butyrivibrio sp. ob235]
MRNKMKWLSVVLCLVLFASMAIGSGSSSSSDGDKKISSVTTSSDSEDKGSDEAKTEESKEEVKEEASGATIEEQVLYDENDIKITATGMEDSWAGTKLTLLIENNSAKGITVQARNANVNGYMVDTMMSADVSAGKKSNDGLTFQTSGLKECGIEQIATMEFFFHIFDSETWDEIVDTDVIKIETSIADGYVQNYDDSGEVLVDTNDVKIVGKGLSDKNSVFGPGVILYIENNSDKDITIQVRDVSVNGFMVDTSMSEDVVAGKKAISAVTFFSSSLEENGITDITDVELYFHIFDQKSWDEIFDSDVITIKF